MLVQAIGEPTRLQNVHKGSYVIEEDIFDHPSLVEVDKQTFVRMQYLYKLITYFSCYHAVLENSTPNG